jgi:hypothetical protein
MKTSYLKHWDKEGTCYNQTITITEKTDLFIKTVNDKIKLTLDTISQKSVLSNEDMKLKTYLKPLQKGKNYTTHTLRNFVFSSILGVKIKDRNTIINIK